MFDLIKHPVEKDNEDDMYASVPPDYVSEINMYVSRDVNDEKPSECTDSSLTERRNEARAEGIYFTANRLLAAWDAGFIDAPNKEVLDVARMILNAAEMLKDATEGEFSREFADEMMEELKKQLRRESGK